MAGAVWVPVTLHPRPFFPVPRRDTTPCTPQVDIKRLATDVLDLSLPLVRKGVKLVNNVGNVPKIVGDNGRIVQVLVCVL